jgi:PAS domain S-box-containing protein
MCIQTQIRVCLGCNLARSCAAQDPGGVVGSTSSATTLGVQMSMNATSLEHLLEAVPDALVGMDQEGVIRFVNRQTETLFDYDRDELIGQPIDMLVPETRRQISLDHKEDYSAEPRTRSSGLDLELSGRQRDGSEFPVNVSMSPIDTGDVLLVITGAEDVARQQQAVKKAGLTAAIVEYSDDAIIGTTLDGTITSWNPAAEKMYSYSSKNVIGRPISLLSPRDRADEAAAILAKITAGQHVWHLETIRVRKNGTMVPVSVTAAPIRNEDGTIAGASAIYQDLTEHKQAFDVAQRMEAIVESSDDAIISITLDGIVTSWNPAAEKLLGYTGEEIIGKSAEIVTPKDRPDEMKAILAKVRAGQHIDHLETIRVRSDGTTFPVSLTVSPIRDEHGAIVGVSMISRNMAELRHAVRYARSLIEAGLDPLVTISPAGTITDVNEATVKATGVPREALIGTDFCDYFTDPDRANECHQQVFVQGSVSDYPLTLVHQDGTLTDVLFNASVYRDFNENVLGVLAVARDAAKLRRQQQLSEQLQEALNSRIVIEQAKGITAHRHAVTIAQAFELMRSHARDHNVSLRSVAQAIVEVGLQV